ncbi:hypothetical protein [Chryseolinea sp. H1M3-3]|uniref:hypothetical protein n=1 Tax=Chryseolinea sp. H1M3-3 TaxID=3034144 RepID=UPI0023EBFC52|nr:hypothetical protein [Chryseolinea sp. H1M3-3]
MKYLLPFLLIGLLAFSEPPTSGIFIVKKPIKRDRCEQELKMLIGTKRVCILKKPLLQLDELEYVTEILYDPVAKHHHIDLGLSSSSINKLNQTTNFLPDAQFALVVDNMVVCTFSIQEKIATRYLRLGTDLDTRSLAIVQNTLSQVQY